MSSAADSISSARAIALNANGGYGASLEMVHPQSQSLGAPWSSMTRWFKVPTALGKFSLHLARAGSIARGAVTGRPVGVVGVFDPHVGLVVPENNYAVRR